MHYQSKSMSQILNFDNIFITAIGLSGLLLIITLFLSMAKPIKIESISFAKDNVQELYTETIEEKTKYLARNDINSEIAKDVNRYIHFYAQYTKDEEVARVIIEKAIENEVPVNLAFSIAWKESSFNPMGWNKNYNGSIDRGLFQLNDSYRQDWTKEEFYDIHLNANEGTRYISEMIKLNDGNFIYALYCYNAGPGKVRQQGIIPDRTKVYAEEILEYEDMLTVELNKWIKKKA